MTTQQANTPFAPPQVKGWCPSLYAPMQVKDGWLVRIRPPFGQLTAQQAVCVAEEAEQHGNGLITLTNRANLQLRGFSYEQAQLFPARMRALGLGLADAWQEKRQVLQVSPLAGLDPACAPDTALCGQMLRNALLATPSLNALPDKFGFAVEGGGLWPLGALQADIVLQACQALGQGVWCVVCGTAQSDPLPLAAAVACAVQVAVQFTVCAGVKRPLRQPEIGPLLFGACAVPWRTASALAAKALAPSCCVGPIVAGVYGLGVPLGQLTPAMLKACAGVAERGDGLLRLTAQHSIVLAGQQAMPKPEGFVTNPADARLRIFACSGQVGCAQAHNNAPAQAMLLAQDMPPHGSVHVSGCAKGCAHPSRASLTVVPDLQGYALVRNGTTSDEPTSHVPDFAAVRAFVRAWAAQETAQTKS
ncbi:MAG: precorrin-3B synthase [Acetobacter orientalis]|uniref:precorrin-3B synthase n=1 Tax=Acetobacter orientalis TaxID=146474 RepID=UPI0039EAB894